MTDGTASENSGGGSRREETRRDETNSKVGRLIERYDLDGLADELEERWTATGPGRTSLRDLATLFNERLLEEALREQGVETLDGEVANTYRLLTDDDVTTGVRTETRRRLEREGIDVDRLDREFVSHQAIHTYLTKYRNVERQRDRMDPEERRQRELETLQRLQNRTIAVTENALDRLEETDQLSIGSVDVLVDVRVFCRECSADYSVEELFERGGCACGDEDS